MIQEVNRNPSGTVLHQFGWAMVLGFGVLGTLAWYLGHDPRSWQWTAAGSQKLAIAFWCLGPTLLLVSYGPAAIARPIYVGWMTGAIAMGTVMTIVMLSVLFVVLLPIFSLIRFWDPLRLKLRPPGESYWEDHKHHESTLERTAHPF